MKILGKIKGKLIFYISIIVVFTYLLSIGFTIVNSRNKAIKDAEKLVESVLKENANGVKARLNEDLGLARSLANTIVKFKDYPDSVRSIVIKNVLEGALDGNERYHNSWLSLELSFFDPDWELPYGRQRYTYYQEGEPVLDRKNLDGDDTGSLYHRLKVSKLEEISEPYFIANYNDAADKRNQIFGTSVCVPLLIDGKFAGTAGMDVPVDYYSFASESKPFEASSMFLVANNGILASHEIDSLTSNEITKIFPEDVVMKEDILNKIKNGESFSFQSQDLAQWDDAYVAFTPVAIGNSAAPWSVGLIIAKDAVTAETDQAFIYTILVALAGFGILLFAIFRIANKISIPLAEVNSLLKQLALGDIGAEKKINVKSRDEISEIADSANDLIDALNEKMEFARAIGENNLEQEFRSVSDSDILGQSLIQMRNGLQANRDEESKRNWVTNGIAKFSDILRSTHDDQQTYYQNFVSEITQYINANQGGLFILNEEKDDVKLELVAAYAFERQKFLKKSVDAGEGLVGQCYLEKKNIYMTELPQDYVNITSGLGDAAPANLLVVPLKIDEEVQGVIEIASFQILEPHEIEFVERIAENLASTISSMKINNKTKMLLEESQQRTEELKAGEEEMRQNMEELEATQEEMRRTQQQFEDNEARLNALINATDDTILIMDQSYNLVLINDSLKKRYEGTKYQMNVGDNVLQKLEEVRDQWEPIYQKALNGEKLEFVIQSKLEGENKQRYYNVSPIRDKMGKVLYAALISRDAFIDDSIEILTEQDFSAMVTN